MFEVIEMIEGDQLNEPSTKETSLGQRLLSTCVVGDVDCNQRKKPTAPDDERDVNQRPGTPAEHHNSHDDQYHDSDAFEQQPRPHWLVLVPRPKPELKLQGWPADDGPEQ